jgi:cytoskeleton protein RodZ
MSAEWADQPAPEQHGIPGKTLAAQREAMGWTVEQVADQLKLAVRQVVALEQGDYANLPGPAVVRGFVRAYAKVVKLDAAPLVAQIALDTPAVNDSSATVARRERPASFSQVRFPTHGKRTSKMPYLAVGAIVLLAGAAFAAWQAGLIPAALLHGVTSSAPAPVATAPAPAAPNAAVAVLPPPATGVAPAAADGGAVKPAEPLPPVISNAVPLISVPPPSTPSSSAPGAGSPAGVAPAMPAAVPALAAPSVAAPAPAAAASNALVLTVREDSWIEVRREKGPKLFSGLVKGGRVETVTLDGPVALIVGNPSAVDASLRGVSVPLPATPGAKVARVNLK